MSQLAIDKLKDRFGDAVLGTHSHRGDDTAIVDRTVLVEVVKFLREDAELGFNMLIDLFGVDCVGLAGRTVLERGSHERFEVVYHFLALGPKKQRVRIKVPVSEADCAVDSITSVWPGADWYERECWDMYGIKFAGHPNLKRIMLYDTFVGHPLRKDYVVNKRQPRVGTPH